MTTTVLIAAAALATGYALGRLCPWAWDRLDTWVWDRIAFGGDWATSRPQLLLTLTVFVAVRPIEATRAFRHRHDPPPPRSAPLTFRDPTNREADQ